ncbi:hypothetical protein SAMN03080615_01288 [Amphritea atlantica]|jgi:hypothetical protein|uniref:Uncharacterized protein n=1 Tax=Amphritea atlantica TaxID=355243 RepID=A0A1H9FKR1_9GAMM|nr:hypothetical protein [Amphritea atlantica]SEQ37908.1 hypothetical protein SAMN03080615_01288 [Amphritea atlantica]
MSDMFLEIIELDDGQIALRRADSDDEPIMRISFSDSVREQLEEECIDVAKVMLTAGIHMISDLNGKAIDADNGVSEIESDDADPQPRVIH